MRDRGSFARDIDLTFRPETYWKVHVDPESLLLPYGAIDPLPDEVEIVRIFESWSMIGDMHSVRAWRREDGIGYRVLNDQAHEIEVSISHSTMPLTLGELATLIDSLYGMNPPSDLDLEGYPGVIGFFELAIGWNFEGMESFKEFEDRVSIVSDFYPELAAFYDERMHRFAIWLFDQHQQR